MKIPWILHTAWHVPQRAHLFCRALAERHEVHATNWVADFATGRDYLIRRYLRNFTYRRDETLREDRCRLKGQGARAMAAINNLVLGLLRNHSTDYLPDARRYHAAHLAEAVALVTRSPAPG